MLADDERALFAQAAALVPGELTAMRHLARTLVLSGFGMTICGGSYPASQGEHLISHYIDMMRPADLPVALHGEQIGVCAIAMAELQDRVLSRAAPQLAPTAVDHDDVLRRFGTSRGEACWRELEPKRFDRDRVDAINARLARDWDAIRDRSAAPSVTPMVEVLAAGARPSR
jgi:glycerol-1-phosphate dehydrogenase [NAD(P)+]